MNKKATIVTLLLVLVLLLAACAPAAVETPAEEPVVEEEAVVEEPVEEEAQVEEPMEFAEPTLITEGLGTADDLAPTDEEIGLAVAHLDADESFIGIVACTYSTDYHSAVPDAAVAYAEDYGISVETFDSEIDVERQISGIENFVSSGADVIVVCVFDPPSVQSALEEAAAAGVYIVQYAGRDAGAFGGVTISIEDSDLGKAAGEYAAQLINDEMGGAANVAILDYPDVANVVLRADAIAAAITELSPDAVIVGNYLGGTTENGLSSMETALQEHPEINAVVSINDAGAYGAMQALEANGNTAEDTIIVGIDAEPQAIEYINNDTMYRGTVDTAPAETGRMTIMAAVKLLAGSTLPQNIRVPVNLVTR
ncbi:MAG: sugar ABC transporter substrate-binding protein [Anaerolineales bacterium]|nr:sugar ABC transporter substrate-binding protein [Anaerolineales bacterium]